MSTGHNDPARCPHCGNFHAAKCPLVKSYEYHSNGTLKRVEFFAPNEWPPLALPLKIGGGTGVQSGPHATSMTWAVGDKYVCGQLPMKDHTV